MRSIVDRFGSSYVVEMKLVGGRIIYTAHTGDTAVARAVLDPMRGSVVDVLVYREADRRRGIASAMYDLIERDLRRPLQPSRIRSVAGKAFWAKRRQQVA
jgi:hypothetical protein